MDAEILLDGDEAETEAKAEPTSDAKGRDGAFLAAAAAAAEGSFFWSTRRDGCFGSGSGDVGGLCPSPPLSLGATMNLPKTKVIKIANFNHPLAEVHQTWTI